MSLDRRSPLALRRDPRLLVVASIVGGVFADRQDGRRAARDRREPERAHPCVVVDVRSSSRSRSATGGVASVVLFGLVSFLALREFLTLTPTRARRSSRALLDVLRLRADRSTCSSASAGTGSSAILIPVYAFLFIPLRIALEGDTAAFLERAAKIQWGLMVCVYCVSHAPALLMLDIPGYETAEREAAPLPRARRAGRATCCSTSGARRSAADRSRRT